MLEQRLKEYARSIGITHLGIGDARPFIEAERLLEEQARAGCYPDFTEREIPARTRPERLLPDARSIISIAVSYFTGDPHYPKAGDVPRGLVSRYAWGRDYHPVLKEKVEAIVAFLRRNAGHEVRCCSYVDTGPPLERAFAERAGIGWYGKNACIYVPGSGSWVFLAEVITNVALRPDPKVTKDCGGCDRCLRACPTGAIERPFWVNPKKCLSYITQMPGYIPKEYRKAMGRRLWGCDVCQLACPWNWEATPGAAEEFRPILPGGGRPELIPLLTMTKSEFKRMFGPTAMSWRGKKILQRNACICLGNIKDPRAVPALADRLEHDPTPYVRASAAWALGQIGTDPAHRALTLAKERERDFVVAREIAEALDEIAARG